MFLFNPDDYPTQTRRGGLPYTKPVQIHILKWLHDPSSRATEQPFKVIRLEDLGLSLQGGKSVRSLINRDWIIESTKAFPETRYQITWRGIKALKILSASGKKHHADDMCSSCRKRPRHQYPSRLHTYCLECIREKKRKTVRFKGHMHDPNKLCSRCHERKRRVAASGEVYVYCETCQRAIWRQRHQIRRATKKPAQVRQTRPTITTHKG